MNDLDRNSPVFDPTPLQGGDSNARFSSGLAIALSLAVGLGALVLFALWTQALSACDRCIL